MCASPFFSGEHVVDFDTAILDEVDPRAACDFPGLVADNAALQPDSLCADGNRRGGHFRAELRAAENVYDVDRTGNGFKGRIAGLAHPPREGWVDWNDFFADGGEV